MTREQRTQHIRKVNNIAVSEVLKNDDVVSNPSRSSDNSSCNRTSLLKELTPLSCRLGLPIAAIEAIACKASEILGVEGGIVVAPGQATARMVLSKTSKRPHLVVRKKNGGLACDDDCPQYKSAGFCSHIVAAAQHDNLLPMLVASYQSVKRSPNLTKLATSEMPKGRGHKGSRVTLNNTSVINAAPYASPYSPFPPSSPVTCGPVMLTNTSVIGAAQFASPYPPFPPSPQTYQCGAGQSFGQSPQVYQSAVGQHPFRLCFITGNISVCHGCKGMYFKESGPPHDLCVQHEEWRTFTPIGAAAPQSRFGNVYYHCNLPCIYATCPSFVASTIVIPPHVHAKLNYEHKKWIYAVFNILLP